MTDIPLGNVTISDAIIGDAQSLNIASGSVAIADTGRGDVLITDKMLGDVSIASVLSDEAIAPMLIQGIQSTPLLTLEGAPVSSYPNALFYEDRTWSDDIALPTEKTRYGQFWNLKATNGGTYGSYGLHPGLGNSTHIGQYMQGEAHTPTELIMAGCQLIQYAAGDAGGFGGTSECYGEGLVRALEYNVSTGQKQVDAVLTSGTLGATDLSYSTSVNDDTWGVGRVLIDVDIVYNAGTVTIVRGSAVVTGLGTDFPVSTIGQYFRVTVDNRTLGGVTAGTWYKIVDRPDGQTLTLEVPYSNDNVTSGAYSISPGAELTNFNTTAKSLTVKSNTIAWSAGHHIQLRIHPFIGLQPITIVANRTLPWLEPNGVFVATSNPGVSTERIGAAFGIGSGKFRSTLFLGSGATDQEIGIEGGSANITSSHFMTIPLQKRITWGSTNFWADVNAPCLVADNIANINYMYENMVKGSFSHNGGLYVRNTDGTTDLLDLRNSSDVTLTKVNAAGVVMPVQAPTASAPAYVKGGLYFDTTLNKLRVGGATGWETVTSV